LASGATEVGQRHWRYALKFRICGAIGLFTFTPKNDHLSENATTISIEASKTLVFRKRFKLFRSDDTINCL